MVKGGSGSDHRYEEQGVESNRLGGLDQGPNMSLGSMALERWVEHCGFDYQSEKKAANGTVIAFLVQEEAVRPV